MAPHPTIEPEARPRLPLRATESLAIRTAERWVRARHPRVHAAQLEARSDGGLVGDHQWVRLAELDRLLLRHRPATVLELGSGGSTAMFASHAHVTTVEESPHWRDRLLEFMRPWQDRFVSILAERVLDDEGARYDIDHHQPFDLVYVDGPGQLDLEPPYPACVDVVHMWRNGLRPTVLVDRKRNTVTRLLEEMPPGYRVKLRSDFRSGTATRYRYHSVFLPG